MLISLQLSAYFFEGLEIIANFGLSGLFAAGWLSLFEEYVLSYWVEYSHTFKALTTFASQQFHLSTSWLYA